MEFTITKEQIKHLIEMAEYGSTNVIKADLKNWFPDAFKTELTIGKWYKHSEEAGLFYLTEITDSACHGYGFRKSGIWFSTSKNDHSSYCAVNNFHFKYLVEATPEEVEAALINEAKKRGYKKGARVIGLYPSGKPHAQTEFIINDSDFVYGANEQTLLCNNGMYRLFINGIWGEILPTEKTVITREKALKILAKKLKVSPENIEIE